jgi:AmmeMemoRadiSam system protein A
MPNTELGAALLLTARETLAGAFGRGGAPALGHAALDRHGATFVTLMKHGELRGCIGTLEAHRALKLDVEANTLAAAFRDPRFAPLAATELDVTRIEVSLLSAPVAMPIAGEDDLLQRLRPGVDGVVLAFRDRSATFLPQVWDSLPEPREFIGALKRKAGLATGFWHVEIRVQRYAASKFREPESRGVPVLG